MIFERTGNAITGMEQAFVVLRNASGETIPRGGAAILDTTTPDGVGVKKPASNQFSLFAGISDSDLANGAYGRFIVAGVLDFALVANDASNTTAQGDVLTPVNGQWYLTRSGAGSAATKPLAASLDTIASNAVVTAAAHKVFLGF